MPSKKGRSDSIDFDAYQRQRQSSQERQRELSASGKDIGDIPKVVDPERKEACRYDFKLFCETYHADKFDKGWSHDHLVVIAKIQNSVLHGQLFAMALPRASGKTTLCEMACEWAALYGHHQFIVFIGSDDTSAKQSMEALKSDIEYSEILMEDFPEVCYPVRKLEGANQRANTQTTNGSRTLINWKDDEVTLPAIDGSDASGVTIRVAGITARIRGMKHARHDGKSVRPSLVMIDDPQTDESANSDTQVAKRIKIVSGAILGLAGPGKKIAGLMTTTIIRNNDLAHQMLDRTKHPDWQGERMKMVYSFPVRDDLWEEYNSIREEGLRVGAGVEASLDFYRANRKEMDRGCNVAWEDRMESDDVSAIQHAMDLRFRNEESFLCEYQNEPPTDASDDNIALSKEEIWKNINGLKRYVAPIGVQRVTAMIDVHKNLLYYVVVGWRGDFSGYVMDYGAYPSQNKSNYTMRECKKTLMSEHPGSSMEAAVRAGLDELSSMLLSADWLVDGGDESGSESVRISRLLVDANWGPLTDLVYDFCSESKYSHIIMPSHGEGITANKKPMAMRTEKKGERLGVNWVIPPRGRGRSVRHISIDTNWWKSFIHERLGTPRGEPGCLTMWGDKKERHSMFASHLSAEKPQRVVGANRTLYEWKHKNVDGDNHLFDCIVGCGVAASEQGVVFHGITSPDSRKEKVKMVSFADQMNRSGGHVA